MRNRKTNLQPAQQPQRITEDISPDRSGGILKTILREGAGDVRPGDGWTVFVHYTGSFENGDKFDSSRDRGPPFDFQIGQEDVIKGWDIGVRTMKLYEKCELKISPEFGFGEKGFPPKMIQPGATLLFEVELLKWKSDDVTERKDGGVLKRLMVEGDVEGGKPNLEGWVQLYVRGMYGGEVFDERDVEFIIGDGFQHDIVDGVEIGVLTMNKNEKSKFLISSKYAFKQAGSKSFGIPSNGDVVTYEIYLLDFKRVKDVSQMSFDEKLVKAAELKDRGLSCMRAEMYEKAITYYNRILLCVQINKQEDSDFTLCLPFKVAANLNTALCLLKLGEFEHAKLRAALVVKYDPLNVKAHFRVGEACLAMKDYQSAISAYQTVLQYDQGNTFAKRQLVTTRILMSKETQDVKKIEQQMYARMMSAMSEEITNDQIDETNSPPQPVPPPQPVYTPPSLPPVSNATRPAGSSASRRTLMKKYKNLRFPTGARHTCAPGGGCC